MAKIIILILTILGIVLLVGSIGAGVYFYHKSTSATEKVEETSDDGLATATATFYDEEGNPITSSLQQSILQSTFTKVEYASFQVKATNTGNVPLSNIQIISPNTNLGDAFNNKGNQPSISNLAIGQSQVVLGSTVSSCIDDTECDAKESCVSNNCLIGLSQYENQTQPTAFSLSLQGEYVDAIGNNQTLISQPVILSYTILKEECGGGTPINTCNLNSKPSYCEFISGSAPVLVDKASQCGCPVGFDVSGESCLPQTCSDGTLVNTFSVNYDTATQTRLYCNSLRTLQPRCNQAVTDLGTIDDACELDYYGNSALSCNPETTGVSSVCVYTDYSGQAGLGGGLNQG